jgi:hypothetical protein
MILAALLSNGAFSFPHLGEYMHEGQPSSHSQPSISCSLTSAMIINIFQGNPVC